MLTVGVSIFIHKGTFSFWSNGGVQNCLYFALTLRAAGYRVLMINGGDGESPKGEALPPDMRDFPFVSMAEVVDQLDVLIECGAQVAAEDVEKVKARGGVAVTYKYGHALAIDAERALHDKPAGAIFNGAKFDCVFTSPQHEKTCGAYWEISYRCPVRILPHIWAPSFVDAIVATFPADLTPGYVPGRAKKRVVSLEPNINLIKSAHVPMLCAEAAWRERPELIDRVFVTNSEHLKTRLPFTTFASNLDICQAKADDGHPVCSFESRYNTPWFMAKYGDVCVSHQWVQVANYAQMDLLYLGYPIVSNVKGLPGYYYPDFDARIGGKQLIRAMSEHDTPERLAEYKAESDAFLETVSATSAANVEAHRAAIETLGARELKQAA